MLSATDVVSQVKLRAFIKLIEQSGGTINVSITQ